MRLDIVRDRDRALFIGERRHEPITLTRKTPSYASRKVEQDQHRHGADHELGVCTKSMSLRGCCFTSTVVLVGALSGAVSFSISPLAAATF